MDRPPFAAKIIVTALALAGAAPTVVWAQVGPEYDAEIVGDDAYALSGPGPNFYPTNRLYRDDKVTVYGKPVGDYLQILPPKGRSFSWVRAADLSERGDGSAEVKADEAVVYVGSEVAREARWVRQVRIARGAKVNILDRVAVITNSAAEDWYKILPPPDEIRYVLAKQVRQPNDLTRVPGEPSETGDKEKKPSDKSASGNSERPTGGRPSPTEPAPKRVFGMGEAIPPAIPVSGLKLDERKSADAAPPKTKRVVNDEQFRVELDSLKNEIGHLRDKLPETWNLDAIDGKLRDLDAKAQSIQEKAAVADTRSALKSTRDNARRVEEARSRWKQFEQKDRELAADVDRILAKTTTYRPNAPPTGVVRSSKEILNGQSLFALADDAGRTTHLLAVPKGLAIEKYLGRRIAVVGKAETRTAVSGHPVVRVEQLLPLDSAARAKGTAPVR